MSSRCSVLCTLSLELSADTLQVSSKVPGTVLVSLLDIKACEVFLVTKTSTFFVHWPLLFLPRDTVFYTLAHACRGFKSVYTCIAVVVCSSFFGTPASLPGHLMNQGRCLRTVCRIWGYWWAAAFVTGLQT